MYGWSALNVIFPEFACRLQCSIYILPSSNQYRYTIYRKTAVYYRVASVTELAGYPTDWVKGVTKKKPVDLFSITFTVFEI